MYVQFTSCVQREANHWRSQNHVICGCRDIFNKVNETFRKENILFKEFIYLLKPFIRVVKTISWEFRILDFNNSQLFTRNVCIFLKK